MAFEQIAVLVKSNRAGMPASVSLSVRGGGRPTCKVNLSKEFAGSFGLKKTDAFDLLLGTGGEKGLLRFKRSNTGIARPRIGKKGGATFHLGHIERFGTEPEPKQFCNAEAIDADTIEIVLPKWAEEQDV